MSTGTITFRTSHEILSNLTKLAESMQRSRNWVIEAALRHYLETQSWQVDGIKAALAQADTGKLVPHAAVFSQLSEQLSQNKP